jgi:hypothetical protein
VDGNPPADIEWIHDDTAKVRDVTSRPFNGALVPVVLDVSGMNRNACDVVSATFQVYSFYLRSV